MKSYCVSIFLFLNLAANAQIDTLAPSFEIVGDYYANNYSVLYPLGWSESGNLAYISQHVNGLGGAQIYTYDFAITDSQGWGNLITESTTYNLEIDTSFWSHHQEFSDAGDTTYFGYEFMTRVYWDFHKSHITKLKNHYSIDLTENQYLKDLSELKNQGIQLEVSKESDTIEVIRVDKKYSISITYNGQTQKIYSFYNPVDENGWTRDFWGNEVDLLYYQIEGYLKSPRSNNYFLFVHEVTMGFEEPAEKVHLIPFKLSE